MIWLEFQDCAGCTESFLRASRPTTDPEKPLEVLRTIHSFDPCMACGVHLLDASGREMNMVRVDSSGGYFGPLLRFG
jgi:Ni,Fe-hydrogenase I large subunit